MSATAELEQRTLTVREAREALAQFPDDALVRAVYDCRCAGGEVVAVEQGDGSSVVLVVD